MLSFRKGFTLIELLVVIAIIATLTAILLPNFMGARQKAVDAKTKENLNAIKNALRLYYNDNQNYPLPNNGWTSDLTQLSPSMKQYMPGIVNNDPNTGGIGYSYEATPDQNGFFLKARMQSQSPDNTNSVTNCALGDINDSTDPLKVYNYVVCAN